MNASRRIGLCLVSALLFGLAGNSVSQAAGRVLIVVGAPAETKYGAMFKEWTQRWKNATLFSETPSKVLGLDDNPEKSDRERLHDELQALAGESPEPLWLILIGHGTFDRRTARFNLRGPDVSDAELAEWLKPVQRPVAVVCCFAASGPFLITLSGPDRVVLVATKSGSEQNFSHFGDWLSKSIADPTADLDKDRQTSLWEAYLAAGRKTTEWYKSQGLLATEHCLLDDNGDKQGTRHDAFRGLKPLETATGGQKLDGMRAHQWHLVPSPTDAGLTESQKQRRNDLELAVIALRDEKEALTEADYFAKLEALLVELAAINRDAE
ncbi:hypothetical protein [Planctellipticum variicoloris]|uniref:hypothetical protein n=1 Tax=Planctellipticum variicoloris TaxID=3064265 RepID=UPI00301355F0|nr:hypothetical protein SH412_002328 [Planctomycetaceae bacterium SH412]